MLKEREVRNIEKAVQHHLLSLKVKISEKSNFLILTIN